MSYSVDWVYDGLHDAGLVLYSFGAAQIIGLPAAAIITSVALYYLSKVAYNHIRMRFDDSLGLFDKQRLHYANHCHEKTAEALYRCAAFLLVAMIPICGGLLGKKWGLLQP